MKGGIASMRWKKSVAVIPVALLLGVAACGGGSGGSADSGQPSQNITGGAAGSGQDPNAVGPAAPVPGAKTGGTITVVTNGAPSTFDPTRAYYTDSTAIMSDLVIRSLTQYKYDAKTKEMILVPDIATDLGTANANNTAWTYHIKPGIKYEDGTTVTAQDVAYAVKRSFAISELPDGPTYNTTFFKDGDKYKGPFKDGDNYSGVKVSGNAVTILMRRPFPDMPYLASFPQFSPIPEAKDNVNTYGLHPLATGPYKFKSYKAGSELTLVKNKYWDPKTDPVRHQYADGWDFKFGQDSTTLDNTIINDQGPAQTTATYDNLLAPDYATAVQKGAKDRIVTGTQPCTFMWYLDYRKIKELKVRQAIGWAYPYIDAWKTGGEIVGLTRVPGTTILPPGTAGRVDNGTSLVGQDGKTTDPAKSKALLAAAGYKPGQYEIRFLYAADDPVSKQVMEKTKSALEAGGFKATPVPTTLEKRRDDTVDYGVNINVRSTGWCSDWPSGSSWFPAQWQGSQVGQAGMPNPAQFKEKAADAKQNHILNTLSGAAAANAWGQFDVWMEHTYYPAVNLGYGGVMFMHGSKVGGMFNDNVRGMPTLTQMYVS
jgi:peptide/nickel transport system substrate-binding protein